MTAYKTFITIDNPAQVVLSDLPFQKGQRVRVVMLTEEDETEIISQRFRELFQKTQVVPEVTEITDEEILAEIAAHRRGE
ncbi:MAG: hypothetical protein ACFB0E_23335 [Leptolyngbyaceae cyanobacterium]